MKNKLITILIATALSNPTFAAPTTTFGVSDCGKWIKEPSEARKGWVLGFLSGLNAIEAYKNSLSKVSSGEQIFLWMDNFCKANPLSDTLNGSIYLLIELTQKK
jgi:hypothetical protein